MEMPVDAPWPERAHACENVRGVTESETVAQGIPSWNRLYRWLQEMDLLRKAAEAAA